ncbi:MAG: cytochrome c family protein [Desulfobacteraceae bacterium]|nr:cytochrome c family protein [Desulfobacteraceae bacterium]
MEILIATIAGIALLVIVVLIATRGRPGRFFSAAGQFLAVIAGNRWQVFFFVLAAVIAGVFAWLLYIYPASGLGAAQPIPFSHRVHAGVKQIDCRFCHPYAERSTYPGVPPGQKCLFCHDHIIAGHPEIRKEHDYFNTNTPVPWRKVNYLPEHVFFNHQRHIKKDVDCRECHGDVQSMDRLKGKDFKMGFCLECHRKKDANVGCWLACHN